MGIGNRQDGGGRLKMDSLTWVIFDIMGTIAFAISGAMVAISRRMDIFGIIVLASLTAVGGGMVRDVLAGITPPMALCNVTDFMLSIIIAYEFSYLGNTGWTNLFLTAFLLLVFANHYYFKIL